MRRYDDPSPAPTGSRQRVLERFPSVRLHHVGSEFTHDAGEAASSPRLHPDAGERTTARSDDRLRNTELDGGLPHVPKDRNMLFNAIACERRHECGSEDLCTPAACGRDDMEDLHDPASARS